MEKDLIFRMPASMVLALRGKIEQFGQYLASSYGWSYRVKTTPGSEVMGPVLYIRNHKNVLLFLVFFITEVPRAPGVNGVHVSLTQVAQERIDKAVVKKGILDAIIHALDLMPEVVNFTVTSDEKSVLRQW